MTLEELKNLYINSETTLQVNDQLNESSSKVYLKGIIGSADALIVNGIIQVHSGTHLLILDDKEDAAYFFNNLENISTNTNYHFFFPASYRHPYQTEDTDNSNVVLRAEVLNKLSKRPKTTVIVSYPEALVEKVVTKKHLEKNTLDLKEGVEYSIDFVNELLIEYEFEKVDYVYEPGQFSVRGGIVDVFSFSNEHPYRIEFFGDEVDSIRSFDTTNQRSIKKLNRITIVPNVQKRLLVESRESFLDFIPKNATIWIKSCENALGKFDKEFEKAQYAFDKLDGELEHLPPNELYYSKRKFESDLANFSIIEFGNKNHYNHTLKIDYNFAPQPSFNKNFDLLHQNLAANKSEGLKNLIISGNSKQIERLYNIFEDKEYETEFTSLGLDLYEGFVDRKHQLACYTDHQIFERHHRFQLKEGFKKSQAAFTLKELSSLQRGDFVVHVDHGVGQYSGLEKIDVNGKEQEAIRLVYKGNDILYVSIHSLHRISKYTGKEGTEPSLNKLGTTAWATSKKKAKSKIKEVAFDLIQLYAKRKAQKGFKYSPDTYLQTELEASFIYEDTPDQLKATIAVKEDMESEAPMDRLVCGDVGFGKTEIAMRAAAKAVADGKQVVVLVPTTILTLQHYKNFINRFKDFPCKIDYLNRFKSSARQKETLRKLVDGETDIIIGTHKLAGKDVKFKDLGLLIIDEEQKFGVGVKDKLKTIKANVDTLTLTATPIPRTLQFSLMGARDLSIMNTPPPNRVPVETELHTYSEELIRDAIVYETQRGGQVYFVHNRVQNIKEVAGMIQRLCPDVRIAIGHGQMDGKKLEEIMLDFIEGMYDVLIATTIIESGIDIPNANTMIINHAENFGLSDLHQLRGRVGRSNKKAFCYLLTAPSHMISSDAKKRLHAIEQFSDLGSGFNISMRDLDIRGAGDLLGGNQSGFISEIGFEMYQKILQEAVEELKETEFKELFKNDQKNDQEFVKDCIIETDLEILIPDDYVNNITERLTLYRELDGLETKEQLDNYQAQLIDRFGPIPEPTKDLLDTIRLRWIAKSIGLEKLVLKSSKLIGSFISKQDSLFFQSSQFTRVLSFIQTNPKGCKMYEKNESLRLSFVSINTVTEAINKLKLITGDE